MANINEKRAFVSNMYPGKGWKTRVKHMSDIQVTAIYLREQGKPKKAEPEKEIKHEDDIPF